MPRLRSNPTLQLPPRVYQKHGAFYYVRRDTGKWVRLGATINEAIKAYSAVVQYDSRVPEPSWAKQLYRHARKSARSRGIKFDISEQDLNDLAVVAEGRCMVSRIPFDFDWSRQYRKRPWAPSIDRIDSAKGYTADNIRLVVVAVNFALNEWGIDVLYKIAQYVKRTQKA